MIVGLGGDPFVSVPVLNNYPELNAEVDRLRLGAHSPGDGMEKICETNGFEFKPAEEIFAGYQRINDLLLALKGPAAIG